ncbi:MAG TPA: Calx-beta domain-containing protein, partial [Chthoniobacterales bacterium]
MKRFLYFCALMLSLQLFAGSAAAVNSIGVDKTTYTVTENDGTAFVVVRVTRDTPGEVRVDFATSNGSATAGSDYQQSLGTLVFAPSETAKLVQVALIDDLVAEPTENFSLTLSNGQNGTVDPARSAATITINDNDGSSSTIGFDATDYAVAENVAGGEIVVSVVRQGDLSQEAVVNYATGDGTATANVDYGATSGSLVFSPGVSSRTIGIGINDDAT